MALTYVHHPLPIAGASSFPQSGLSSTSVKEKEAMLRLANNALAWVEQSDAAVAAFLPSSTAAGPVKKEGKKESKKGKRKQASFQAFSFAGGRREF